MGSTEVVATWPIKEPPVRGEGSNPEFVDVGVVGISVSQWSLQAVRLH